ncbi:hypothetical protein CGRA01v4_13661 [Colletotrichum graminicola]|nr:hypothetical protein CGRA01v4_13661 [Colletotrichum graminicola]
MPITVLVNYPLLYLLYGHLPGSIEYPIYQFAGTFIPSVMAATSGLARRRAAGRSY